MNTAPQRYEPIVTIGQVPFAAGTILLRNQMRLMRRRRSAQRWQRLSMLFCRRPDRNLITWRRYNFAVPFLTLRRAT
jgi:hypothetical protein